MAVRPEISSPRNDSGIGSLTSSGLLDQSQVTLLAKHSETEDIGGLINCQDFKVDKSTNTISIGSGSEIDQLSVVTELGNQKRKIIQVSGASGAGKKTLVKQVAYCFQYSKCLHSFDCMLIFNEDGVDRIVGAEQTPKVQNTQQNKEPISQETIMNSSGLRWLIVFQFGENFLDKLPPGSTPRRILEREILPEGTILYVCLASQVEDVQSFVKVDQRYALQGFTIPGMKHYLRSHQSQPEKILSYIEQNQLVSLCTNPLVCAKLSEKRFEQPSTLAHFFYNLICALLFHYLDSDEKAEVGSSGRMRLENLPDSTEAVFRAICLLAVEHMQSGHRCTNRDESQQFLSSFVLKLSGVSVEDILRFGLVESTLHSKSAYKFRDPKIAQFLAAYYLYRQPPLNQLYFLYKNTLPLFLSGFKLWLRIFFGLIGGDYMAHLTLYNPTKLMMNTVIDVLVNCIELNSKSDYRYNLIECIHELQERSLLRKLASRHPAVLSFSVSVYNFNVCVQTVVSALINKSGCSEWTISTSSDNTKYAVLIKEQVRGVSIITTVNESVGEKIHISPKRAAAAVAKMYRDADGSKRSQSSEEKTEKFNQFCCRSVREILQKSVPSLQ